MSTTRSPQPLLRRLAEWFPIRVARRFVLISGYDRALALATQAFVALVPMLIVLAATVPAASRAAAGTWLLDRLRLSGDAASAVQLLVQRPSGDADPVTVFGAVLLVVSVVGFTRSLQRTYLAAWGLPSLGLRGFGYGLLGAVALVAEVAGLLLVAPVLNTLPGTVLVTAVARAVPSVLLWWPVQRLLLGGHVRWRDLLPGAAVAGLGQTVVMALSGLYVPESINQQAARFGLIGIAFVLVSWLVVLGLLLVVGAVFSAELGAARRLSDSTSATSARRVRRRCTDHP